MLEESNLERRGEERAKDFVGYCMIGLGIFGAVWIATSLAGFLADPSSVPLVKLLSWLEPAERTFDIDGRQLILAPSVARATGLVVYLAVMGIAAGLVRTLIMGGVNLLEHDVRRMMRSLRSDLKAVGDSVLSARRRSVD